MELAVRHLSRHNPPIRGAAQPSREIIVDTVSGVANGFDLRTIMGRKDRAQESTDRMSIEVRRDVPNPETAVWARVNDDAMRRGSLGMASRPLEMCPPKRAQIDLGKIVCAQEKIAVQSRVCRRQRDSSKEATKRTVDFGPRQ
jgi:hypothetical protein